MIVTLTAHPALDRSIALDAALRPGDVQSGTPGREDAGGKGINVARAIKAAGHEALAVLPLASEDPYAAILAATGTCAYVVPIEGHARVNLTLTDPTGETTKINLPGAVLSPDEAAQMIQTVAAACDGAEWLVLAGSLPPGVADDFYVDVIDAVRERWGAHSPRIAVDTSGPALAAVVERGRPDLIKPNEDELAELAAVALETMGDASDLIHRVVELARSFVPERVGAALVTLGGDGAVLIDADGAWAGTPPPVTLVSTVGAGDSSLAGFVLGDVDGLDAAGRLRRAIQYGAAAASLPGSQAPTPADLPTGHVDIARINVVAWCPEPPEQHSSYYRP
ncbi:1-phosphofructokinase family hexose kinase [Microbacterium lacus]|uniref:1-phosphofructokinase family hexose kinase n=1 Tax=Microbacterium lacus TaxID=415217 RepID=UPI000C2C3B61|nr:1-phosphofructokinase family hexose kinase [Microbacterium lacus]